MPTYEYVCKACDEHLEVVQAFTDPPLSTCAACGGELRKVFGNVGIVFKGSGFYKTDSRAGSTGSSAKAADGGKSDTGAKTDTPAPKAEPVAAASSGAASTVAPTTAPAAAS